MSLLGHVVGFNAHNTTSPLTRNGLVLVESSLAGFDQNFKILRVLLLGVADGNAGSGLHTDELSQPGLSLDNGVSNSLLAAESWHPDGELDRIDIMSNQDQFGLVGLDEISDVVDSVFEDWESLGVGGSLLSGHLFQPLSLLGLGLRGQLLAQTSDLRHLGLVNGVLELSDTWRNLQSLKKDSLLPLEPNVSWPFGETGQITFWLDVSSNTEVPWAFLEKRRFLDAGGRSTSGTERSLRNSLLLVLLLSLSHCVVGFF